VASVLNPQFGMSEKAALAIASGKPKGTIATIKGDWNKLSEQEAVERAKEYLKSPEWRQVGMDPERHSYFYDRATMQPVTSADEALQIGPLVLVKNPVYGKKEDFKYAAGGMVDSVPEEAIKNMVKDPQAARLLDLDLAKYALMNQPQKMAAGGIARMAGGGARKVARDASSSILNKGFEALEAQAAQAAAANTIKAADRAAAGRAAAAQIEAQPEVPMSEALGNLNTEGKRIVGTQYRWPILTTKVRSGAWVAKALQVRSLIKTTHAQFGQHCWVQNSSLRPIRLCLPSLKKNLDKQ
jgi:hypothetical protein